MNDIIASRPQTTAVDYLKLPGTSVKTDTAFEKMLPPPDDLNSWQEIQHRMMLEQWHDRQPYSWTPGHDGCTRDQYFRNEMFLRDRGRSGVYCCGLALEHWFKTHREWMDEDFESDIDLTTKQIKDLKAYFYVYATNDRRYQNGCGTGIAKLGEMLEKRWKVAKDQSPADYGDSFQDDVGLQFAYHTDPFRAGFGAYCQLQSQEDIFKGGGHAGIFTGLEQRRYKGEDIVCVRLYQANSTTDYGMEKGVNFGWYKIGKITNGFERVFHFGEVIPVGE